MVGINRRRFAPGSTDALPRIVGAQSLSDESRRYRAARAVVAFDDATQRGASRCGR